VEASAQFKPGQNVTLELPVRAAKASGTTKTATKTAAKSRPKNNGSKVATAKTPR
jgi:hypothetical protein